MINTLEYLLQLKRELHEDFKKDLAAVDYLIARRTQKRNEDGGEKNGQTPQNGNVQRGRPATVIGAVRHAIRSAGHNFNLDGVASLVNANFPGHKYSRKAISSGLARLADKGQLKKVQQGINGESLTVYAVTEKFPPARS